MGLDLTAPSLLEPHHDRTPFRCGAASLDAWLHRRALPNQLSGATRTYVVCHESTVVAYYALAAGAVAVQAAPGRFRRNMPDPVPVILLARLAVDQHHHGHGLGRALVRDAALRVLAAADLVGIRGLLTHALSEDARRFYLSVGFEPSPLDPQPIKTTTLMLTITDLRAALL